MAGTDSPVSIAVELAMLRVRRRFAVASDLRFRFHGSCEVHAGQYLSGHAGMNR